MKDRAAVHESIDSISNITADSLKCIQCGVCSSSCPSGRHTSLNIRRLIINASKSNDLLTSKELWMCTTCYNCQERCPRSIDIVDILLDLRAIAVNRGALLPEHRRICMMLLEHGHAVPITEADKKKRTELGMEELPETVHKYKEGLEEVRDLLLACGFDRIIEKNDRFSGDNTS